MSPSDRNPLRESPGKGDKPRNCHNPKFRKNYDGINWDEKILVSGEDQFGKKRKELIPLNKPKRKKK